MVKSFQPSMPMPSKCESRPPRSWFKDAKWIAGLLVLIALGSTLLVLTLARITDERPAVEVMTRVLAASFSQHGLDDTTEIALLKKVAKLNPRGSVKPIPFLNVAISNQDLLEKSPRELRLSFFRQLAVPLYRDGPEGLAALATDREIKKSIVEGGAALKLVTAQSHALLERILFILILITALLLIPLIVFSVRFGRLISPGVVFLLAGLPGFASSIFLATVIPANPPSALASQASTASIVSFVASYALPIILPIAKNIYGTATAIGLVLLLGALLGKIGLKIFQRLRPRNAV